MTLDKTSHNPTTCELRSQGVSARSASSSGRLGNSADRCAHPATDTYSPDEQCEAIVEVLSELTKEELIEFENIRHQLLNKAYTWPVLKACFIVLSYVSDDVFEGFRHWIILNGKDRFYRTLENPNCVADYIAVEDPIEEISGEPLLLASEEAWDGDIEDIEESVVIPKDPEINDDDWPSKEGLRSELPELFDKFWNEEAIRRIHKGT